MREVINMQVVIYKTPDCPRCRALAAHLRGLGIDFGERDMSAGEVLADLRCDGVFALSAPILQVDEEYHESGAIWNGDNPDTEYVRGALKL